MKTGHPLTTRRAILGQAGLVVGMTLAAPAIVRAQTKTYPTRPVRVIVPFAPGGGTDLVGRIACEGLSRGLGQNFIVENIEGAATQIGTDQAAKAANDGYTLLFASSDGMSVLPAVKPSVPFKLPDDFEFISGFASNPLIVGVNAKLPIHTLSELAAYGKAHPRGLKYTSSGTGTGGHVWGAYLAKVAGIEMIHVPYRGGSPALIAVAGGFGDLSLVSSASMASFLNAGTIRGIATTGQKRSPTFPNIPTVVEGGMPDLTLIMCTGLYSPAGVPEGYRTILRNRLSEQLKEEATDKRLFDLGVDPFDIGGAEFRDYMAKDLNRWREVAKIVNVRLGA
jgi:tripartite-type tricarboxylate transporter receptor subunit TctC